MDSVATAPFDAAAPAARAAALAPLIADAAPRIEQDRRLPDHLRAALHDAGLFRLLLPARYGGGEVAPLAFARAIEALAAQDGSTAWCVCQANGCAMASAYVDPAVAMTVWGDDPAGVLAWGPGKGRAIPDGDAMAITGQWAFASGGRHATWIGGHSDICDADGNPQRRADGGIVNHTALMPAGAVAMTDIWDTLGLRGTASDAFAVNGLRVPREFLVSRDDPATRRVETGLYQLPAMSLYASGFAATALGLAGAMLDAFIAIAGDKTPRLARTTLRDDGVVQFEVAQQRARLGAARAFLHAELAAVWDAIQASGHATVEQRMRIRLAGTHAIHEAKTVADGVYDAAGATAIFHDSPFERRFRDLHTVTQQLQGRRAHYRSVGAWMLGNPPDMTVI